MSGSHEKLPMIFWVQIALVLIVGAIYIMTPAAPKHHGEGAADVKHEVDATTKTALKPVGEVAIKAEAGASATSRSGEEIVKAKCAACHVAGVANAPKLDASGKDAWEKRMAAENGLDGLVASAQKGKGGMPPNAGDPSLSADELKSSIVHMLAQVGIEVAAADSAPAKAESKPTEAAPATEAPKTADTTPAPAVAVKAVEATVAAPLVEAKAEEKPVAKAEVVTEEVKEPVSPTEPTVPVAPNAETVTAPAAPKAAAMPVAEVPAAPIAPKVEGSQPAPVEITSAPKAAESATEESKPAPEPVTAPTAPMVEEEAKPASEPAATPMMEKAKPASEPAAAPMTEKAKPASEPAAAPMTEKAKPASEPAATPMTEEAKPASEPVVAPAAPAAAKPVAPTAANETAAIDLVAGEKTYKTVCFSCHDLAVANAPKPGDKAAWAARIAKGMDVLYNTALKGDSKMPTMPAKGGNPTLSDSDVKNAVLYMVELSK